jgi:hypothetical protein
MEKRRLTSFYSLTDFEIAHQEVVDVWIKYKEEKHNMTVAELCNTRDDITILGGQIADMDVDLYYDYAMLKTRTRKRELEEREKLEVEYRAKKVTAAADKARYQAELLVSADREEEALAKAIHLRAYNLYSFSIPEMLRSIASRINALMRTMPIGAPPTTETTAMPSMNKFTHDSDNFEEISRRHGFTASGDDILDEGVLDDEDKIM